MKKTFLLVLNISILLFSCNSEDSNDCWQTTGKIIEKEIELPVFTKIEVHENIELIIEENSTQQVIVETGSNLLPDIALAVIDGKLILKNNNTCNLLRAYNVTRVFVRSPNITEIRNASQLNISSIGTLNYPNLYLQSVGEKKKFLAIGDWHLNINNTALSIWSNGISNFYLKGQTNNLSILFSDGDTRFEGQDFLANTVQIKQVSSNDIVIAALNSLKGTIHSVGNVICYTKPNTVEVTAYSKGKLIFK